MPNPTLATIKTCLTSPTTMFSEVFCEAFTRFDCHRRGFHFECSDLDWSQCSWVRCGTCRGFHGLLKFARAHVTGVGGKNTVARSSANAAKLGVVVTFQVTNDVA